MIKGYSLKNLFLRILSEFQFPQTYYGKKIRYKFLKFNCYLRKSDKYINLLWDLNYEAATFDLSYALLLIDNYCKDQNIKFNVIFIRRVRKDFKNFYPHSIEKINLRVTKMLIPLCKSFKLCNKTIVLSKFNELENFKHEIFFSFDLTGRIKGFDYKILFKKITSPSLYEGINSNKISQDRINKILLNYNINQKRFITVTLRTYSYEIARNTDKSFWLDVLKKISKLNFFIIIIPDTDDINNREYRKLFSDYLFIDEIALDLNLKIAIYEKACTNLFPYSGNATLSQLNKKASSFTFIKTNNSYKHSTERYFNSIGQTVGETYKFLSENHHIYWNGNSEEFFNKVKNYLMGRFNYES